MKLTGQVLTPLFFLDSGTYGYKGVARIAKQTVRLFVVSGGFYLVKEILKTPI